jgi:hypothetical protein
MDSGESSTYLQTVEPNGTRKEWSIVREDS